MTIDYDPAQTYTDDEWQELLSARAPVPRRFIIVREGGDDWHANWTAGTLTHASLTKMGPNEREAFVQWISDSFADGVKLKELSAITGLDVPTVSKIKNGRYRWR